ncbi:hypothetical protein BX661DRAFT_170322 [Kickxella alabastrina]|uniref:uncharacterized protein n=1 Tax=Kickxella alabastrina TaxID=61397 RepID=UPI00221F36C4|nr:uncharacterized protein BX661DRAFT_170322 [Kickxella alabastrina]KAI7829961.1 hypothetical protein BX661DRAFT_170322 [Kickxella alabastrina]
MSVTGSSVKSALMEVIDSHARLERENTTAKRCRPASMLHALLDIVCYFSESSVLHIAVNRQRLGSGWQGRVVFTSSISKQKVELESPAEPCESGGSVFCYRLPSLRNEWTADFSLVFSPQYTVPSTYIADIRASGHPTYRHHRHPPPMHTSMRAAGRVASNHNQNAVRVRDMD